MKKWLIAFSFLFFLYVGPSLHAHALTFDHLPTKQTSDQWSVQVGKAMESENSVISEKGKFHTYSLKVDNLGDEIASVKINMYRNEPDSKTKYSLFGCPDGQANKIAMSKQ
ncbi:hypothetical protein [Neobacillus vireti]|uniref:hypothetical protein n=1 Tax=Neobacillus vireti TaxID=220686 RepID=UPI0003FD0A1B|nr:hypothetical protein [Neobacillus vireti]